MTASIKHAFVPTRESGSWADSVPTWMLFAIGTLMLVLTGARYNLAPLAWVSAVPFLLYARRANTRRDFLKLFLVLLLGLGLQMLKIATPPLHPAFTLMFSLPAALSMWLIIRVSEWARRRMGDTHGVFVFAALNAVSDVLAYRFSELGAWPTLATTQTNALVLLQISSVVGLWGIGFLMAWTSALVSTVLGSPTPRVHLTHAAVVCAVLVGVLSFGTIRLDGTQKSPVRVAAVTTDLGLTSAGIPSAKQLSENTEALYQRSERAAKAGARLIAWPEAATLVEREDEAAFLERGKAFARAHHVDFVLAYATLLDRAPLLLDNKLAFITSEGAIADTYRKHHLVPSEPSLRGTEPLRVVERPYGKVATAICYDYDFPTLAREHARLGANLVVVPSSDWRGIDPVHTEMARIRAIEGGFSLLRAVRWAPSAGFDAYGRVRGFLPAQEDNDKVLVTTLPLERVSTLYPTLGEGPVLLLLVYLTIVLVRARKRAPLLPSKEAQTGVDPLAAIDLRV